MTDNEIIKALEHCKRPIGQHDCENCPYVSSRGMCSTNMLNDALSLINRQNAEIEKKDIEIDILIRKKEALNDEISDSKAEIERLQQKYELSEAEREANVKGFAETLETVKAEAIKEFAERAKELPSVTNCEYEWFFEDIDNLVKEMTENQ